MTGKNPFEIRSDVLKLATEQIEQAYKNNVDYYDKMYREGQKNLEDLQKVMKPYSLEDIMKQAQSMYDFVQKK